MAGSLVACMLLLGCTQRSPNADPIPDPSSAKTAERGRQAYSQYCRACHGEGGKGDGPASLAMRPPPRDFTSAQFKFGWVVDGLPSDEALVRIVQEGLHGTAMLPSRMPRGSLDAILQHVKTFDVEGWQATPLGTSIEVPTDPWGAARAEAAVERGSVVYHSVAQCHACHPAYVSREEVLAARAAGDVRADLHDSRVALSDYRHRGERVAILAPDFTWHVLRSVRDASRREDLYRVIAAGIPGSGMPTWEGALEPADLWALAWYIDTLVALRDRAEGRALRERLKRAGAADAPVDAGEAAP